MTVLFFVQYRARKNLGESRDWRDFACVCPCLEISYFGWNPKTPTRRLCGHEASAGQSKSLKASQWTVVRHDMNDEHPLVLELTSLRQTAARFEVCDALTTIAPHPHIFSPA